MLPLTILAAQKVANLLINQNALGVQIGIFSSASGENLPNIPPTQIVLSSASADLADNAIQLSYPRVCLYSSAVKNTQKEKFRSLSGTVSVTAEVWASANMLDQTDRWIHYYVEAITNILRQNIGDWGDGMFFPGAYDVQFQQPKVGGLGYVESAKVTCSLNVSQN